MKYPEVFQQVIEEGHSVGNHTHHHINGWKTTDQEYLNDILGAGKLIKSNLFRPPYGRIRKSQIRLLKENYSEMKIVMWNILVGDWVVDLKPEKCFERIKSKIADGDIIVFHDSEKAFARLAYALPRVLQFFSEKGYRFLAIPGHEQLK